MGLLREMVGYQIQQTLRPNDVTFQKEVLAKKLVASEGGMKAIANMFEYSFSPASLDRTAELISKGYDPVILANHSSHVDGIAVATIADTISRKANLKAGKRLKGFYLIAAESLLNGDQGKNLQELFELLDTYYFSSHHTIPVGVTRKLDIERYNTPVNWEGLKQVLKAYDNGYGTAIFPEGTTTSGRMRQDGEGKEIPGTVNGLQLPDESFGGLMSKRFQNGNILLLPVGIDKSYSVFDPNTKKITREAQKTTAWNFFMPLLPKRKASVTIGDPIILDDLQPHVREYLLDASHDRKKHNIIAEYCMVQIAGQLPPYMWGKYANILSKL